MINRSDGLLNAHPEVALLLGRNIGLSFPGDLVDGDVRTTKRGGTSPADSLIFIMF